MVETQAFALHIGLLFCRVNILNVYKGVYETRHERNPTIQMLV